MAGITQVVQRFQFDRRFDAFAGGGSGARPSPRAAEAVFTREDVEQARADGFARGRAEAVGAEEARRSAERLRQQTLDAIAAEVRALTDGASASAVAARNDAVLVAAAIVRTLLPRLWRESADAAISAMVRSVLASLSEEPLVTVRMAPSTFTGLQPELATIAAESGAEGRLHVVADAAIGEGDCRIEWRDGGVLRDRETMWQEISRVIEQASGAAVPAVAEPSPAGETEAEHG